MVFKKAKMIERLISEGREDMIKGEAVEIMDNLDGCEVDVVNWRRMVFGEQLFWCVGKDGVGYYVNENDCE